MGFVSVCRALYDYQPQSAEELEIKEGELLYILEVGEDSWWKARKKAEGEDGEEPEGLIPNNYVEEAKPTYKARALYDYTRQTDEEVSFPEETILDIYDSSDPDWTLVGINGEYGFAPANYIEIADETDEPEQLPTPQSPARSVPPTPTAATPAASLARVLGGGGPSSPAANRSVRDITPEASDEEQAPALPRRPPSQSISSPPLPQASFSSPPQHSTTYEREIEPPGIVASPPHNRVAFADDTPMRSPGGFHLYNISEMVSVMGRRKKMPTTLGLNIATGTIMLSPEKARDGPTQEWTADKLNHYSIEGKHVFLELVRPSKSLDLHAGAKDTAQEIVSALGEIAGAHKAEGFKEVIAAASGGGGGLQKKGVALYDFMAQGDDEVTVAVGDEVIVLDSEKSEEWWMVRRVKNGKEGVMPSLYIEVTGLVTEPSRSGVNAGKSTVEQNRLEEERLAKEVAKRDEDSRQIPLPARGSSLGEEERRKKDKRSSKSDKARSKPDPTKTRTWTDQSGSFKVDAQFIGIADGKIHLHKANGVKIAVPVTKMSAEDLEYVEKVTNESIEEHIPVADLIKMKRKNQSDKAGASIEPSPNRPKGPEYDWFDLFLSAGVGPHQCERYAQAMIKDSMDESVLPDITTDTLRNLGLKEGDALKVMKYLDQRFGRTKTNGDAQSGIFSGPGGALRDNTRRGRPEANRTTNDVVDASAFDTPGDRAVEKESSTGDAPNGFDDDAWDVKPSTTPARPAPTQQAPRSTPAPVQRASENMAALSLLDKPLEPTPAAPQQPSAQSQQPQQQQQTGANPSFFTQIQSQPTSQANAPPRQRPQPPQQNFNSSLLPPPRPASAPQTPQNQFGIQSLQPQMTGLPMSARPAPPGQSLDELTAQRMQQQFLQSQPTGYGYGYQNMQQTGFSANGMMPQQTGFPYNQQMFNGNTNGSPFADPRPFQPQPTGFLQPGPAPGSLNSVLPPALVPMKTGYQPPNGLQPQQTGYQPVYQQQIQQPQQTGFGQGRLQPQPTGFGQNG